VHHKCVSGDAKYVYDQDFPFYVNVCHSRRDGRRKSYSLLVSMTIEILDHATVALVNTLAQTPTQQLVILITQHPSLPSHTSRALRTLADEAVQQCMPPMGKQAEVANSLADTLRRLIERGDPSQARRLVPSQTCLVDLALCCDARDILARLMDKTSVDEAIKVAMTVLANAGQEGADASHLCQPVSRAAYIFARMLYCLPRYNQQQTVSLTSRRTTGNAKGILDAKECVRLLSLVNKVYASMSGLKHTASIQHRRNKLCLIETTWQLIERYCSTHLQVAAQDIDRMLETIGIKGDTEHTTPLSDATLAYDVNLTRPMVSLLESKAPVCSSLHILRIQQQTQSKRQREKHASVIQGVYRDLVQDAMQVDDLTTPSQQTADGTPLFDLIYSILPYWQDHGDILKSKLKTPSYAGQSDEMIIQMLMDEGEAAVDLKQNQQTEYEKAMEVLNRRANVFNDEPLDVSSALTHKGKGKEKDEEITSDLKAFILARASAPDSDEEDGAEWDPLASHTAEIGFEEELEDGFDGIAPARGMPRGDRHSDTSEEEDLERAAAREEGEGDGALAGAGHSSAGRSADMQMTGRTSSAAAERAAETILVAAWKEKGETLFAKDARKSASRNALLVTLSNVGATSKKWDDQLVESWGTMFARNPRKDKMLASLDDPLRTGNPNRIHKAPDGERTFGANRGRGGRLLRDDGDGSQRGRGSGHRGRGRGGSRGNKSRK
jgi:activating signal cointegrator complex subunit 2